MAADIACVAAPYQLGGLFLVGVPKQLPPVVTAPEPNECADVIGTSPMTIVWDMKPCPYGWITLDIQFRMHPQISAWPNKMFYDGALKDHTSVTRTCGVQRTYSQFIESLEEGMTDTKRYRIAVDYSTLDFESQPYENTYSFYNPKEAQILVEYAAALLAFTPKRSSAEFTKSKPENFVIVTPYSG
ncbi:hypothetical protein EJ04DRAFT_576137 [Polyplosphaeria fusca]|uniref:DNA2/NAM7 helicase-like C-terminal domain-containing protein n=1 Tax=Polyplosphaeria fusca TaxID=682080 RepID=A0A9P4V3M6_9PLEO|nr:hypothetical protein EJ04DRAFT_576137 [Polyplosphaeria fusca]